jgi:hypothetical protein
MLCYEIKYSLVALDILLTVFYKLKDLKMGTRIWSLKIRLKKKTLKLVFFIWMTPSGFTVGSSKQ